MAIEKKQTTLSHLLELRSRLIKSAIAVLITTIIALFFAEQIFEVLIWPTTGINLIFIEMTEMLGTYMRVSLLAGIILAMPYITYHLIMFVSPALTKREKKYVWIIVLNSQFKDQFTMVYKMLKMCYLVLYY